MRFDRLVAPAELAGGQAGRILVVQGVEDAAAPDVRDAAEPGPIVELVHDDGIDDEGGEAQRTGDLVGDQAAQVRGVLPLDALIEILEHPVVDPVNAARDGDEKPPPADDRRQAGRLETLLPESPEDEVLPEGLLVHDPGERRQLFGGMGDIGGQDLALVLIDGDLGRCRTRIDDQKTHDPPS